MQQGFFRAIVAVISVIRAVRCVRRDSRLIEKVANKCFVVTSAMLDN